MSSSLSNPSRIERIAPSDSLKADDGRRTKEDRRQRMDAKRRTTEDGEPRTDNEKFSRSSSRFSVDRPLSSDTELGLEQLVHRLRVGLAA
jgi:hypothetical protein